MSLTRQLLVFISVLLFIVFFLSFVLSVKTTRDWLQDEAIFHAQDTATSLALSVGPFMDNENDPLIESMLQAIFDRTYYSKIELRNTSGDVVHSLLEKKHYAGVPAWFKRYNPMLLASAEVEISTGWPPAKGVIEVVVSPDYAYRKLYRQFKQTLLSSLGVLIVALCILYLLILMLLKSLKRLEDQARKIAAGEFIIVEPLPRTREIKNLAFTINSMSSRLGAMTHSLQKRIDVLGDELLHDDLTGLANNVSFEKELAELFKSTPHFYVFKIRMDCIEVLVKEYDKQHIDRFLQGFADLLSTFCEKHNDSNISCYRLYGADFVLVVEHSECTFITTLASELSHVISGLSVQTGQRDIAHIGIAANTCAVTVESLMNAATEAYEHARLISTNSYYVKQGLAIARTPAEWKELVFHAIERKYYPLQFQHAVEILATGSVLLKEVNVRFTDEKDVELPTAMFIATAEKFPQIVSFEKQVFEQVIQHLQQTQCSYKVALNVSIRSIKSTEFQNTLKQKLERQPHLSKKLVICISAYAAMKERDVVTDFSFFAQQFGIGIMLKRFDPGVISLDECSQFRPNYIRLARSITQNVLNDTSHHEYIRRLADYSRLMEIHLLAEQVQRQDDAFLQEAGLYGASY